MFSFVKIYSHSHCTLFIFLYSPYVSVKYYLVSFHQSGILD